MESAKMDEFVEGLSLQDYYKLMTKLGERFTKRPKRGPARKPWSQNKHAQLKLKGCVNHAINIAAQGETTEFLHDLAKQHPKIIQPVQERGDEDRVLENLKCVYHRLQNTSHEADQISGPGAGFGFYRPHLLLPLSIQAERALCRHSLHTPGACMQGNLGTVRLCPSPPQDQHECHP